VILLLLVEAIAYDLSELGEGEDSALDMREGDEEWTQ